MASKLIILVVALLSTTAAAESYDNSCAAYVAGEVESYLQEVTSGQISDNQVVSIEPAYSGANPEGEWIETYKVLIDFDGVVKNYVATLNGSCGLESLEVLDEPHSGTSFQLLYCETYEEDCEREDGEDDDGGMIGDPAR